MEERVMEEVDGPVEVLHLVGLEDTMEEMARIDQKVLEVLDKKLLFPSYQESPLNLELEVKHHVLDVLVLVEEVL